MANAAVELDRGNFRVDYLQPGEMVTFMSDLTSEQAVPNEQMRAKFDRWYASPRGEAQFELGMHYMGWAYICYAEGYKQATLDMLKEKHGG